MNYVNRTAVKKYHITLLWPVSTAVHNINGSKLKLYSRTDQKGLLVWAECESDSVFITV